MSHQPQQPKQQTLSSSSSATSTVVPDTSTATATSPGCKRIHLDHLRNSDVSKPGHPTCSAESSGNQRTAATHRAADFIQSCRRQTAWTFKSAYFHTDPDKALQLSCLFHRHRKSKQHIRTLKLLWESTVSDEVPTDRNTTALFITQPATRHLSSNHHHAARTLIATASPVSASHAVS